MFRFKEEDVLTKLVKLLHNSRSLILVLFWSLLLSFLLNPVFLLLPARWFSKYDWGRGLVKIEDGKFDGIFPYSKKGWHFICSRVILFAGSTISIFDIRFLAFIDIFDSRGNVYSHYLIFLYVFFTSDVSKGGLPYRRAYVNAPKDQISTS